MIFYYLKKLAAISSKWNKNAETKLKIQWNVSATSTITERKQEY